MGEPVTVASPDDDRLRDFTGLSDPELRKRVEGEGGFFIAESPLVVRRLLTSGRPVRSVLVTPEQAGALADVLVESPAPVFTAELDVLRSVVGFDLHRGAVASADRWPAPPAFELLRRATAVAVLENINDHENLGMLFRNAAALGIDAVLLDPRCSDPFYRRSVRVSIGWVITLPWTRIDSLDEVHAAGFSSVALTPNVDAPSLHDTTWPARAAIVVGAEGPGLSHEWLDGAHLRARIPMERGVDSLNVATAAAIAFDALRLSRRAE